MAMTTLSVFLDLRLLNKLWNGYRVVPGRTGSMFALLPCARLTSNMLLLLLDTSQYEVVISPSCTIASKTLQWQRWWFCLRWSSFAECMERVSCWPWKEAEKAVRLHCCVYVCMFACVCVCAWIWRSRWWSMQYEVVISHACAILPFKHTTMAMMALSACVNLGSLNVWNGVVLTVALDEQQVRLNYCMCA